MRRSQRLVLSLLCLVSCFVVVNLAPFIAQTDVPQAIFEPPVSHTEDTRLPKITESPTVGLETSELKPIDPSRIPQCKVLGLKFVDFLTSYLANHTQMPNRLIYNCESNVRGRMCGGMGDRFRGIITTFYLALVTGRRFQIYHPVPVPLQEALKPNLFDWTVPDADRDAFKHIPVDTRLMKLKLHKQFVVWLSKSDGIDLRLQSNSFNIDPYLLRVPKYRDLLSQRLGFGDRCNITCYFGCLHAVLFQPSAELSRKIDVVWKFAEERAGKAIRGKPFIAAQIRIGGSWAAGLRVKEPFRTHPSTLPHYFSVIDELRRGNFSPQLHGAPVFVSSDAERLMWEAGKQFGNASVFFVPGDAYQHTDTLNLGDMLPGKHAKLKSDVVRDAYFNTLVSHHFISESSHVVMAQSGFGDTAFWRSRRSASAIFVDMNNNRIAWQHHLEYDDGPNSVVASQNRIIDTRDAPKPFYR